MSARFGALPIEQSFLLKAWLTFVTVAVAVALTLAIIATRPQRVGAPPAKAPTVQGQTTTTNPATGSGYRGPIVVNGKLCGQCR